MDDVLAPYDELQQQLTDGRMEDRERVLACCRSMFFELLGMGSGRIAIAAGPQAVVKLAWRERGLLDNQIEGRMWEQASAQLRSLLCPVIGLRDSGVLVQSRCLPVVGSALDSETQKMVTGLAQHGITDGAVNLGFLNERIVCYDYASLRPETFAELFPDTTGNFSS